MEVDLPPQEKQAEYWRGRGLNLDTSNSLVRLFRPSRPAAVSCWTETGCPIGRAAIEALLSISNQSDLSLYILLVTLLKAAVARYTGNTLVSIVSPFGRGLPGVAETATVERGLVLLQDRVLLADGLRSNAQITRRTVIGAYSHQDGFSAGITEPQLHARIIAENLLVWMDGLHESREPGDTPLEIRLTRADRQLSVQVRFDESRICRAQIEQFAAHLARLIDQGCAEVGRPFEQLALLSPAELSGIESFSTGRSVPRPVCLLHELFVEQARRTPLAAAVIHAEQQFSYAQLDELSDRLARGLVAAGVIPGDFVALLCKRGVHLIAAMLAVGKAGAAFVPISPEEPGIRRARILEIVAPRLVITNLETPELHLNVPVAHVSALLESGAKARALPAAADPSQVAYAIFTSGSSGAPKGVLLEHSGIVNSVIWQREFCGFSTAHRFLQLFPCNFDGFILTLYAPLTAGTATVLIQDEEARLPAVLARYFTKHQITHVLLTPALYQTILEECTSADLSSVLSVMLAGDAPRPATIALSRSLRADLVIANEYGPTETSVVATFHPRIEAESATVIGQPIDNVTVHILDEHRNPVPVGVYGQIALGGAGLARGYLGARSLSDERFVEWRGRRVYLTGDVGRWTPEGNVEFRARIDERAKIRGYRVDVEEIRQAVLSFGAVRDAVILVSASDTEAMIVACITAVEGFELAALISHLQMRLPGYMIPTQVLRLATMPLTHSGKYDLDEIKARVEAAAAADIADMPNTDTERRLAALWCEILKLPKVGVERNFFALGGHSLKATRLLSRVKAEFELDLQLEDIFRANTVRALADIIDNQRVRRLHAAIKKAPAVHWHGLSFAQERMLVLTSDERLEGSYNILLVLATSGSVVRERLQHALDTLLSRHESLRTYFGLGGDRPQQAVAPGGTAILVERDIGATESLDTAIQSVRRRYDLTRAPLWSAAMLNGGEDAGYLVFEFNHIIIDEASLAIFCDELVQIYNGTDIGAPQRISYIDYATWQREQRDTSSYQRKLEYWRTKMSKATLGPIPLPRPEVTPPGERDAGAQRILVLDEALSAAIATLRGKLEVSSWVFFVAAFVALLHRLTGRQELVIGSPVSNRSLQETQSIIGLFINTLLLRYRIDSQLAFDGFLQTVKQELLEDLAHGDTPLDDVLRALGGKRFPDNRALFNVVMTVLDNEVGQLDFEGFTAVPIDYHNGTAKFDLLLEVRASRANVSLVLEYDRYRLSHQAAAELLEGLEAVLRTIVAVPNTPLTQLPVSVWATDAGQRTVGRATPVEGLASVLLQGTAKRRAPITPLEHRLVQAWADVLALQAEQIAVEDSFFMLGGDSLAATTMAQRIRSWGYSIKLGEVFENDTVEYLARLLEERSVGVLDVSAGALTSLT